MKCAAEGFSENKNTQNRVLCVFAVNEDKMKKNRIASCNTIFNKEILSKKEKKYYQFVKSQAILVIPKKIPNLYDPDAVYRHTLCLENLKQFQCSELRPDVFQNA